MLQVSREGLKFCLSANKSLGNMMSVWNILMKVNIHELVITGMLAVHDRVMYVKSQLLMSKGDKLATSSQVSLHCF
jgi:hypothetical protein